MGFYSACFDQVVALYRVTSLVVNILLHSYFNIQLLRDDEDDQTPNGPCNRVSIPTARVYFRTYLNVQFFLNLKNGRHFIIHAHLSRI